MQNIDILHKDVKSQKVMQNKLVVQSVVSRHNNWICRRKYFSKKRLTGHRGNCSLGRVLKQNTFQEFEREILKTWLVAGVSFKSLHADLSRKWAMTALFLVFNPFFTKRQYKTTSTCDEGGKNDWTVA